jgi:membrane protease YdiL (CAAX protease family)
MRQKLMSTAIAVYSTMAGVAIVWSLITGRPLFWIGEPPTLGSVLLWTVLGAALGFGIVLASRVFLEEYTWAKSLADWFSEVLGPITVKDALILALLSGFAEEMLVRGALQPSFGLIPTTILFGLCHWPPRKELRPWTYMTAGLGLLFGIATEWSGHLAAAIVAHFVINFINLSEIGRMSKSTP